MASTEPGTLASAPTPGAPVCIAITGAALKARTARAARRAAPRAANSKQQQAAPSPSPAHELPRVVDDLAGDLAQTGVNLHTLGDLAPAAVVDVDPAQGLTADERPLRRFACALLLRAARDATSRARGAAERARAIEAREWLASPFARMLADCLDVDLDPAALELGE